MNVYLELRHSLPFLLLATSSLANHTPSPPLPQSVDVAIIGAGLSGLTAASHLLAANKSVLVLEARSRVGGKVYNYPLRNGGVTEVGAEFVGPTQDHILRLIEDLGLKTFDTYTEGQSILWRNNTKTIYTPDPALGGSPPVSLDSLTQISTAQTQLNTWASLLSPSSPFTHPRAAEWDAQTLEEFLIKTTPSSDAHFVLTTACKALFSAEPHELSLLYVLSYIAGAGNETTPGTLDRLVAVQDGAQEKRVIGGTGLIPERLAEQRVGYQHIALNAAVSHVTKTADGYEVLSRKGKVHAKDVVLAISPPLQRKITFTPRLPLSHRKLNEEMKMPALGKGIAIYNTPFWRQGQNLSAQVLSDSGSVRATFDSTPDSPSFGAILGFILADEMRYLDTLPASTAQSLITSDYTRYFGPSAQNTSEFVLFRWDLEEWSLGAPTAVAGPRVLSRYGQALGRKVGGLHFAGTETGGFWAGYMDGAVRSGKRVAGEILGR
ncbi:amine oxidase [Plenodomus tracheiphilus IPT5]|uniref:Amine oxidase n=1 Tax=Plenodomus tracheiphilus IPT5 TaxID=1408161 RepID=A0A6A7AY10_9PLEO|nr:amine oxidase [Plenodomus tracheiphilus IPT5]